MAGFINLTGLNKKKAYDLERLTYTTTAVVPTASKVNNVQTGSAVMTTTSGGSQGLPPFGGKASAALITVSGGNAYVTFDGTTTPSSTNGATLITAGDVVLLEGYQNIKNLKAVGSANPTYLDITYFKE
jgi:hypothetical protein